MNSRFAGRVRQDLARDRAAGLVGFGRFRGKLEGLRFSWSLNLAGDLADHAVESSNGTSPPRGRRTCRRE